MSTTKRDRVAYAIGEDALFMDGYDEALIGHVEFWDTSGERRAVACYDEEKVIRLVMKNSLCSYEDACEYMEFNQKDAYLGPMTPAFLMRLPK